MIKFEKKQVIVGIIFFTIIISLYLNTYFHKKEVLKSISENKVITIGYVYKFNKTRSFDNYYYFYHQYKLYYTKIDKYGLEEEKLIGKYFYLEYSSKNPNFSIINLEKEITNPLEIKNAGFNID